MAAKVENGQENDDGKSRKHHRRRKLACPEELFDLTAK
jgi:hypothetical protein